MEPFATRTHEEMKDVLMEPYSSGPDSYYYMMRGGSVKQNITVWEVGVVGKEYIKTYGHYHVSDFKEVYTILSGEGVLLLQTRAVDESGKPKDDEIVEFKALRVKKGDVIAIPPHAGHLMVNTGTTWLVASDNSPFGDKDSSSTPTHADYAPVKRMRGFAYYVVEENGSPTLVKNPLYKSVPEAKIE